MSRKSKKIGNLVNDKAKETLDKMRELKATTTMTSKEICEKELGYIPGHLYPNISRKTKTYLHIYVAVVQQRSKLPRLNARGMQSRTVKEGQMKLNNELHLWLKNLTLSRN